MPERSSDWLRQAEVDIEKAKLDLDWGYFEWACFTAQQAAEKAIKSLFSIYMVKPGAMAQKHC